MISNFSDRYKVYTDNFTLFQFYLIEDMLLLDEISGAIVLVE